MVRSGSSLDLSFDLELFYPIKKVKQKKNKKSNFRGESRKLGFSLFKIPAIF